MTDPPGLPPRLKPTTQPLIEFDNSKVLKNTSHGPKYLVVTRIDSTLTLATVSPFLIKKIIDYTAGSEIDTCKKLRNGNLLIKTKDHVQANKLIKVTSFSPTIPIEITEHTSLNYSKGVIYSNDLRGMPESEILSEFKFQDVIEAKKILLKINEELHETGLIILTFTTPTLPSEISIGYEKVRIRPYIPLPLRCNNCQRYGHIGKFCKNYKICFNCSNNYHVEEHEECNFLKSCINCKENNLDPQNHNTLDKKCPIFIKEKEIQSIITLNKVDRRTAITAYNERNPHNKPSYSSITKQTANTPNRSETTVTKRQLTTYNDILSDNAETPQTSQSSAKQQSTETKIKIFPKNISNRLKAQLKKKNATKPTLLLQNKQQHYDSSDSATMDLDPTDGQ